MTHRWFWLVPLVAGAWWLMLTLRRRRLARAAWVVWASGRTEDARSLLVVARGATPPFRGLVAVEGCDTEEHVISVFDRRPDLVDTLLLWRSRSTVEPERFARVPGESTAVRVARLRTALTVTSDEQLLPAAVRQHEERAANRDFAAFAPLLVILGSALPLMLAALTDEPPVQRPVVDGREVVCSLSSELCELATATEARVGAGECSAAVEESARLGKAFTLQPERERTEALERAVNFVVAHARACKPTSGH